MSTIHEQADGQPTPDNSVAVHTDPRSARIIKEVFLPNKDDTFSKISLAAIKESGRRGLPITVNLCGSAERGRISIVSTAICCMITAELTDKDGEAHDNMLAEISKFGTDGVRITEDAHNGPSLLQLSINANVLMNLIGAIISSSNPTFSEGCGLISDQYLIDPDGNDEDQDNTDPQDIGGEVPTSEGLHENQIPFPAPIQPEPAPVN